MTRESVPNTLKRHMRDPYAHHRLTPRDITLNLLQALATLTPDQREAWVDNYITGKPQPRGSTTVTKANRKLAAHYGTADRIREAA